MKSKKITIPNHTSHISALSRRGVILLAVLIVVSMLALGAYTFSDAMYAEARGTQMFGRSIQAHMLADSGIEFVLALLADPSLTDSTGGTYNNPDLFHQMTVREDPLPRWSGRFSVIASSEEGNLRFGISDESSKLNLNALMDLAPDGDEAALALLALPEMTEETADAIVDWLDEYSDPRTFGAEEESYDTYGPRNGRLGGLMELALIRGVSRETLLGEDLNRNGQLDSNEDDGTDRWPDDNSDGTLSPGWLPFVTLSSRESMITEEGQLKINLNDPNLETLQQKVIESFQASDSNGESIGEELAEFIGLYRQFGPYQEPEEGEQEEGEQEEGEPEEEEDPTVFRSIFDLVGTRVQNDPEDDESQGQNNNSNARQSEPEIIESPIQSDDLPDILLELYALFSVTDAPIVEGRININEAPAAVLNAIPGMDDSIVQQIIDRRSQLGGPGDGYDSTPGWLVTENILTLEQMRDIAPWITIRGGVFRVQVMGYFDQGGPMARVEAIIDTTELGIPRILGWSNFSELGEAFDRTLFQSTESP